MKIIVSALVWDTGTPDWMVKEKLFISRETVWHFLPFVLQIIARSTKKTWRIKMKNSMLKLTIDMQIWWWWWLLLGVSTFSLSYCQSSELQYSCWRWEKQLQAPPSQLVFKDNHSKLWPKKTKKNPENCVHTHQQVTCSSYKMLHTPTLRSDFWLNK